MKLFHTAFVQNSFNWSIESMLHLSQRFSTWQFWILRKGIIYLIYNFLCISFQVSLIELIKRLTAFAITTKQESSIFSSKIPASQCRTQTVTKNGVQDQGHLSGKDLAFSVLLGDSNEFIFRDIFKYSAYQISTMEILIQHIDSILNVCQYYNVSIQHIIMFDLLVMQINYSKEITCKFYKESGHLLWSSL